MAIPPAFAEHVANIARWFPKLLLELGAPDLEDNFEPGACQVVDYADSRTLEVALQSRPGPAASTPGPLQHCEVLKRLGDLAAEFEALAARGAPVKPRDPQQEALERLGALADQVTSLVARLQACPAVPAPPPPPPPPPAPVVSPVVTTPVAAMARPAVNVALPVVNVVAPEEEVLDSPPPLIPATKPDPSASPRSARELSLSPRSARGNRQLRQRETEGCVGRRSRTAKRQGLKIAITKVQQLQDLGEPASPKFVTKSKVWESEVNQSAPAA